MKTKTLFSAFAIAQTRNPGPRPAPAGLDPPPMDDMTLLSALRHSATDRDQIIQRRIGVFPDPVDHE